MDYDPKKAKEVGGETHYGFTIKEEDICNEIKEEIIKERPRGERDIDEDYIRVGNVFCIDFGKSTTKTPYYLHAIVRYQADNEIYTEYYFKPFDRRASNLKIISEGNELRAYVRISSKDMYKYIINSSGSPGLIGMDTSSKSFNGITPVPDSLLCKFYNIGEEEILSHLI